MSFDFLQVNKSLQTLNLMIDDSDMHFTLVSAPNHVFSIDFLQVNTSVTILNMNYNSRITDQGWAEFAKGLAVLTLFLRHLLLCSSFLGPLYYLPTIFTTQDIGNISKNCSSST